MASHLPTDPAGTKAVDTFGIGTYDSLLDGSSHGEDDESREPSGPSIPDGGPTDGFDTELLLGYPQETALGPKHATGFKDFLSRASRRGSDMLPGDFDRPPWSPSPSSHVLDSLSGPPSDVVTSQSELPEDAGNPASRSDYYDRMTLGDVSGIWPSEDSGSYVTQETKPGVEDAGPGVPLPYVDGDGQYVNWYGDIETIPSPETNDVSMDDFLGALGNSWGGYTVEDQSVPYGFPSDKFVEEADFLDENPIFPEVWELQPFGYSVSGDKMSEPRIRQATDLSLVGSLTTEFLKSYGKKNIVRRHVLAFLQEKGLPQYLASDVIRCLKHRHKVVIPDVMDTFPISSSASANVKRLSAAHDSLVEGMIEYGSDPEASSVLRRCAAKMAAAIALLERTEGHDG